MHKNILSFEETDSLKGLLILLIIMGHIKEIFSIDAQFLLYTFHITTFLFLPFLFNENILTKNNMIKVLRRYYVPYSVFFLVSLLAFTLYLHNEVNPIAILLAWFLGTGKELHDTIGFSTYWFFPTLVFLLFMIMIYNELKPSKKLYFFYVALIAHFLITMLPRTFLQHTPMSLYIIFYIFCNGLIIKYIYNNLDWQNTYFKLFSFLVFSISLFLVYGSQFDVARGLLPDFFVTPYLFILHDLIMLSGFFVMVFISSFLKWFKWFGMYSIALYTVHPFIIQIIGKVYHWNSIFEGFIKFLLVLVISYIISKSIFRFNIDKIIYPR